MALAKNPLDFQFGNKPIRCVGTDRDLWFVAKDVCEALGIAYSGATLKDIPKEWRGMMKLNIPQINQYGTQGLASVEMTVINEAALYKLAFRSRSAVADEFTNWVASEVLPSIRKTGAYVDARRKKYEAMGKSAEWIGERAEGIEERKGFTTTLKDHGVEGGGYGACTNAIYSPILGGSAVAVKAKRSLPQKANLRDSLSKFELAKVKLSEMLAAQRIDAEQASGNAECAGVCRHAAKAVEDATATALNAPIRPALNGGA